jgi:hypothetical protein
MEAFELVRENMEKLLAQNSISDEAKYGISEKNPDINWETTVESFYEPVTSRMWMQAVCSAEFADANGQNQKIELTHWITGLNKDQILKIIEQKQREEEYRMTTAEPSDQQAENTEQQDKQQAAEQQTGQNQQQQNEQNPTAENIQAWKDAEKIIGPPPAGYNSWQEVPEELFLKVMTNSNK